MRMTNNTVFITGGCSGIGLALARAFSKKKNRVIVCDRDQRKVAWTQENNPDIKSIYWDITNIEYFDTVYKMLTRDSGGIDILINNASLIDEYRFLSGASDYEKMEELFRVNLFAPIKLTKQFLPMLLKSKCPAVVNIGSPLAYVPRPVAPLYCASKAALHSLTKSMRSQLKKTPVKVFEVMPPTIDTEMTKNSRVFKISTDTLAKAVMKGLERNRFEIRVGYSSLLYLGCRLLPGLMDRIAASSILDKRNPDMHTEVLKKL